VNCEEVDELLGAFALHALPPDEAEMVQSHLAGCPEQAEQARQLRAVASRLPAVPDAGDPPPRLRERILAAVASVPQDSPQRSAVPGAAATAARSVQARRGRATIIPFLPRASLVWAAIAAVFVGAFIGLVAWNVVLQTGGGDDVQRLAERASNVATLQAHGVDGSGVVILYKNEKKALVVGDGLRALDAAANTYQLWAIDSGGTPKSIGLMQAGADGHVLAVVPFDPAVAGTLAVTIEPAGGSGQPTSAPIFTAKV